MPPLMGDICVITTAVSLAAIAFTALTKPFMIMVPPADPPAIQVNVPPPHVVVEVVPVGQTSAPVTYAHDQTAYHSHVQLLKVTPDGHSHIGYRDPAHPDVTEALNNPALAVRWPDGRVESQSTAGES